MSDINMVSSCRGDKFDKYVLNALKDMRVEKDFCDVTLVCGNGHQLLAHKLILSAYSPFFHNLLRMNPHPHPLIYLRGASYTDVQAILDYMYMGEANVASKNVDSFVTLAKDLEIKGLEKNYESPSQRNHQESPQVPPKEIRLGDSTKKNTSQDISSAPQNSLNEKLPQVKSAKAFSPRSRSSSNEDPSHSSTKQPGPQEQTQQKFVGIKRSSSSSVTPPSKSVRTGASFIQDLNESSESKTTSGIKQGNRTSGLPNLDDTSGGHIDLTGVEADKEQNIASTQNANDEEAILNSGCDDWDGMNGEDGDRKSIVHSDTESSDSGTSNSGTVESYGDAKEEIDRRKKYAKENLLVEETQITCKICLIKFDIKRKWNAHRHIQTVHFGETTVCLRCGMVFKHYDTLAKHHKSQTCSPGGPPSYFM